MAMYLGRLVVRYGGMLHVTDAYQVAIKYLQEFRWVGSNVHSTLGLE